MEFTFTAIKSRKIKLIFFSISLLMIFGSFLYMIFIGYIEILNYLLIIGLILLISMTYLSTPFYSWTILSFLMVFLGLFFKRNHWPAASALMTLGTVFLGFLSIWNSVKFIMDFRNNPFLKWVGFVSGIIVTVFMTGLLYGNQHWSGLIRDTFAYSGGLMFILLVMAIVFTLPNSNYIEWHSLERKVFFRSVLIPMIFVFALITLIFVFTDTYNSILGRSKVLIPWADYKFELLSH
jgi:hypothetical protein